MLAAIDLRSLSWLAESVVFDEVSSDARSLSALAISASVIEPELEKEVKSAFRSASLRLEIQDGGLEDFVVVVVVPVVVEVMVSLQRLCGHALSANVRPPRQLRLERLNQSAPPSFQSFLLPGCSAVLLLSRALFGSRSKLRMADAGEILSNFPSRRLILTFRCRTARADPDQGRRSRGVAVDAATKIPLFFRPRPRGVAKTGFPRIDGLDQEQGGRRRDSSETRIERSRLRRRSGVEIVVDVRRLRKQTNLVRVVANARHYVATSTTSIFVVENMSSTIMVYSIPGALVNGRIACHQCIKQQAGGTGWNSDPT